MVEKRKKEMLVKKSEMLKIIAHPMRLCILNCLVEKSYKVNELVEKLETPQSTLSQHLSKLRMAGIVTGERQGVEIKYSLINEDVIAIIKLLVKDCDGKFGEN